MSIHQITLGDPCDQSRPFEQVLSVSSVGDLAFVSVVKLDEGNPTSTETVVAEMTVSLPSLRDALVLLCQDRDRESLRGRDDHGLLPDLVGQCHVVVTA